MSIAPLAIMFGRILDVHNRDLSGWLKISTAKEEEIMPGNIFYIIGVIVVVLFILGYLGLR